MRFVFVWRQQHASRKGLVCCFIFFLLLSGFSKAQNGKLLSAQPWAIHDTDVVKLQKRYNDSDSIFGKTAINKISYRSEGLAIAGYIVSPVKAGKYPVIVYCRGGNGEFGSLNNPFELFYLQRMASWGYVVVASQYRGCCGSEGRDEFGGDDINDVMNLLPLLNNLSNADTSRVGIHGWSRGGMMTYQALKKTNRFKAAAVGAGAANLYNNITMRKDSFEYYVYARLMPDYYANKDRHLQSRSVTYWADSLSKTTPLLLMQGSADWRVSPEESLELVNKLYQLKHPLKFILYPGGDHGLREYRAEVDAELRGWFDEYLKKGKTLPNMEKHGR